MAREPFPVSLVERQNDDPNLIEIEEDVEFAVPGAFSTVLDNVPEEIEIELSEDGGALVDFDPQETRGEEEEFSSNLAEFLDDGELGGLSNELMAEFEANRASRGDWEETYSNGLSLLGLKYEERSDPFRGATGVTHPLLAEAATQFQAQAFNELLPPSGPVRTVVMGDMSREKEDQASRVKEFMNYYITNVMEEYTPEFDQMLFYLPLAGSTFKKVYYDEGMDRAVSKFVPAEHLIVPYEANDLETCPNITQVIRMPENELR